LSIRPIRRGPRAGTRAGARIAVALLAAVGGLAAVAAPAQATGSTVITVNSANDPGNGKCDASECTLREAITKANSTTSPATIRFAVGTGPITIGIKTNLPAISHQTTIDGTTQPGYAGVPIVQVTAVGYSTSTGFRLTCNGSTLRGLIVNEFSDAQVVISGSANKVVGNYLGTDASGNARGAGGATATVRITGSASRNLVDGNVVGGGGAGVLVDGNATNITVSGNSIGVGADGTSDIGSFGSGIRVADSARGTDIRGNRIGFNAGPGIDLGGGPNDPGDPDGGPNGQQNSPVLSSVTPRPGGTEVAGTLDSTPNGVFTVDVYASAQCAPGGGGQFYVGSLTTTADANGSASFGGVIAPGSNGPVPADLDVYTATATQTVGGAIGSETSEFSACVNETPPFDPPSPPNGVAVGAGDGLAQVTWLAPDSDGGSPLDHYTVTSAPGSSPIDVPVGTTIVNVPGLANGQSYTFTVTATNQAGLTSAPSEVSQAVTPLAGTVAPEAVTADLGAGGSLSTGDDATAADPVNTTVNTPNAGLVSIGEGAMTGTAPAGTDYIGQQIDINAPDATAGEPMRFTFVVDCTAVALGSSSCAQPAAPAAASVQVRDGSYSPSTVTVAQGGKVTWSFTGARSHSVTDALCLGSKAAPLFSSGARKHGSTYSATFAAAGSYAYKSTVKGDPSSMKGTVNVPVAVSQPSGAPDTSIQVSWATAAVYGFKFDVQYRYRAPGASTFSAWKSWTLTTSPSKAFVASSLYGAGDYEFRSALKNASSGRESGWSPAAPVTIARADGTQHLADISVFHETDADNVEVPDCTGPDGVAQPAPSCVWSETIRPDGDLEIVVYTTHNNRWRVGKAGPAA
jgi:CSLREA domain-containing protein